MSQIKTKINKLIAFAIFVILIFYFSSSSTTNSTIATKDDKINKSSQFKKQQTNPKFQKKVKATFVTLARNNDLWELLESIQSLEDRFNHKFGYDWVFLNDEPFSEEFIYETTKSISGETKYGVIPFDYWSTPIWIDTDKAEAARQDMKERNIIYGDSLSYRYMCRFESGFFFRHPYLDDYDYYWRVEPSVKFYCDIDYDIFQFMQDNDMEYGFTIALHEYIETIPTLWDTTKEFISKNPKVLAKDNSLDLISDDNGETYNLCHFWSNFEIGKLEFLRSKTYRSYFDYLDKSGGFFYERWGDAPIHTIAAALFLDKEKIHFFDDIGYYHGPFTSCPIKEEIRTKGRCSCNPRDDITFDSYSCMEKYYEFRGLEKPAELEKYQ
ncbi:alpha-1,2-mannosyltransferase KRE2 [Pichia californica]|uniref:Alpha-1,2-mannosyltransferase KRE2 n=1 Tax=Pichia californica TaxID=460514 RepID=A0A9P6WJ80_9ASCO|nr:alpha-1,2-mannosyltransferase KRE2 [[Candida] californica]KAG0687927.1 alpha-1,2-mannosyltransferase KRE2 [[Candida] californica]